jgi:hypothetical protein
MSSFINNDESALQGKLEQKSETASLPDISRICDVFQFADNAGVDHSHQSCAVRKIHPSAGKKVPPK